MNIQILPMPGYTAQQRAEAISEELFAISRPKSVKSPDDISNYLFGWITHKTEDKAILQGVFDYIIKVHPDKNIFNLTTLFPELSQSEIEGLTNYINSVNEFPFQNILPSNTVYVSDEEMDEYE